MFWTKVSALSLLFCTTAVLEAAIEKQIDEKHPHPITFSRASHNRIVVEGGSIEKVIGDSSIFSITIDRSTGQAFVNILQDILRPVTLTVITNSGSVQDLLITSREGISEPVILKEADDADWEDFIVQPGIIQESATVEMLERILEGKIPMGYGERALGSEPEIGLPKPLTSEPIKALEGVFQNIIVYRIRNTGQQPIVLTSEAIKQNHHIWVLLNAHNLAPNQEALCLIAYSKDKD